MKIVLDIHDLDFIDNQIETCRTILCSEFYNDNQDKWTNQHAEKMFNSLERIKELLISKE